ncbi:putative acyl-CoA dehydrogenase [bacterium BMS3Abin05]|nr:putative acyl-CoA dehydrogenase [bacterium BMS3Abin05]
MKNSKKIALLLLGGAVQKYTDKIADQQEVLGHIADVIIEVYAMESALSRVKKMAKRQGEEAVSLHTDVVRAYLNDSINRINFSAQQTMPLIAEGDTLRTYLTILRRYTKYTPINTAAIRRRVCDHMGEAGMYNL